MLRGRRRTAGAVLLGGILLLAACGSDDGDGAAATTAASATTNTPATTAAGTSTVATDAPSTTSFPISVEHKYGTTDVPAAPERVVSVGYTDQDDVLALGVVPVGIRDWYGDQPSAVWPWAQDELGDAEPAVLSSSELNFEAIAALRPDLIVGVSSGMTEEEYGKLSEIAPTIAQPAEFIEYGTPWQEQTRLIGKALGKEAQAEQLVADTEALFAEARAAHPEFEGATAVVAYDYGDGKIGGYGAQDVRTRLLLELGFTLNAAVAEKAGDQFYADFAKEQIDLLDSDLIVWVVASDADLAVVEANELRPQLKAYAEGREVLLGQQLGGAASFSSPLSLPYLLDELVPQLADAVDGEPDG